MKVHPQVPHAAANIPDPSARFLVLVLDLVWMIFHVFLASADVGTLTVCDEDRESLETLRFTVNIESLALVLYSSEPKQVSRTFQSLGPCLVYVSSVCL